MPEREGHRDHVETPVLDRQGFGGSDQGFVEPSILGRNGDHAFARIDADDQSVLADDGLCGRRGHAGSASDVQHLHPGCQAAPEQRLPPVAAVRPERDDAIDAIVVRRGLVEACGQRPASLIFGFVILREPRMRPPVVDLAIDDA